MFQEEKRKINYGAICLVCFFSCFFFAFQFMKLITTTTQPSSTSSSIVTINSPIVSGKLSDRREGYRSVGPPPSTYCIKIESFSKLVGMYESRPFASGGYNWTLIVYPRGNKKDGGDNWMSLYVRIDNSTLLDSPKEVYAEVKFLVYNRKEDKYFLFQETDPKRVFLFKPYWGFPTTVPYNEMVHPDLGWTFDGDTAVIGVDVFVTETFNKWEVFSLTGNFHNSIYKWAIPNFTSSEKQFYVSEEFVIGGRSWALKVYPRGDGEGQGNSVSLYIVAADVKSVDKIYLRAKLRILNQKGSNHVEKKVESWSDKEKSWGFQKFVPFSDLKDTSKGLLVDDTLKIEVEIEDFSNTKYFPS